MASSGVPLFVSHDEGSFRLMEVPDSVMEVINTGDQVLQIKSAVPEHSASEQSAAKAVLCTANKTFELRQIQTSNRLHLLKSSIQRDTTNSTSILALSVTSQCKEVLELESISPDSIRYLRERLPRYEGLETVKKQLNLLTKESLLEDAPFSEGEFVEALIKLSVLDIDGHPWIPSANILCQTWMSLLSVFELESINIENSFSVDYVNDACERDGSSLPVLGAVLRSITLSQDSTNGRATIDREKTIQWLGAILLERHGRKGVSTDAFTIEWKDHVSEKWREHISMEQLKAKYIHLASGQIAAHGDTFVSNIAKSAVTAQQSGRSKWHEKFKNSR